MGNTALVVLAVAAAVVGAVVITMFFVDPRR
jgi:hypothetical protein